MRHRLLIVLAVLALLAACGRPEISAEQWKAMSPQDKTLVVESMRGHEAAREAKGGTGRLHPRETTWYLDEIDARYARGDNRSVSEIWNDLVEPKP
ncbi:MAG: hypothetical protein NDJ92_11385 [Thermoanaerobaculia bacterium]|nr:hypothetical protein [Thermoanaerobaculia bacterium]